jgi:peptidoglycan L-alanyl-D-glutamate endopeptidase CwlK
VIDRLQTLTPILAILCRRHLDALAVAGIRAAVVQGLRTEEQQAALWAQGRALPGRRVTNAQHASDTPHGPGKDGKGRAYDIALYDGNDLSWADHMLPLYDRAGEIGEALGLVWGGRFKSLPDRPHYELKNWRTM